MLEKDMMIGQKVYVMDEDNISIITSIEFEVTYYDHRKSTYEAESADGNISLKDLALEDMVLVSSYKDWELLALFFSQMINKFGKKYVHLVIYDV